jgi:hypothetical protein
MTESSNPYASPQVPSDVVEIDGPNPKGGALAILIVIVVLTFAVNVRSACQNWGELTLPVVLAMTGIGFGLPLVALYLIWRGNMAGRWILVVLFGLRGAAGLECFIQFGLVCRFHPMFFLLGYKHLIAATVFLPAATWLAFSPSLRHLIAEQKVKAAAGRNLPAANNQ